MAGLRDKSAYGPVSYAFHRHYKDDPLLSAKRLMRERLQMSSRLFTKDLKSHYGCVNAIEFSHGNGELIASGGDDRRVLLWQAEKALSGIGVPVSMTGNHHSNIFCLAFDNQNKKIFSGGNDEQVIVHDLERGEVLDVFFHDDAVYGLSVDPLNDNVFASACDDGRILIYDTRAPASNDPFCLANYQSPMHAVMYNPVEPRLLATANSKEGIGLWDVRKPKVCLLRYGGSMSQQSCMSVRISSTGDKIIALRRRLPPVLYNIHSPVTVFNFDHCGYYNSCTMKSCCFAGDKDQYIISGSDDFNLYVWRIPDEATPENSWVGDAQIILQGHRSIVNQVRYNPSNSMVISSGVEKVIKAWSPFVMPDSRNSCGLSDSAERPVYTHEEYINLILRSGQVMSHDYSQQSTDEDPRMMAFFDSLVQRELEGWTTEDSLSSHSEILEQFVQESASENSDSQAISHSSDEGGFSPFTIAFASVMANRSSTQGDGPDPGGATRDNPTSAVLDLDNQNDDHEVNDQNVGNTNTGPPTPETRRSISSLIAQKRREYLASVKIAMGPGSGKPKKAKILAKRQLVKFATSSESESDGTERRKKERQRRKGKRKKALSDSSVSEKEDLPTGVAAISKPSSSKNEGKINRLKRIRLRIMKNESDSSSDSIVTSTPKPVKLTNGKNSPELSDEERPSTSGYSSQLVDGSNQNGFEEVSQDSIPSSRDCDTENQKTANLQSVSVTGAGGEVSTNGEMGSGGRTSNGGSGNGANGNGPETNGANGSLESNHANGTGNTTWSEFKRFKNRVERARRQYRRRSSNAEDQNSD